MGFSKQSYDPVVSVEVHHAWYPREVFTFIFPKQLPQAALDREQSFFGLKDDARKDAHRVALVDMVAEMVESEPEGFEDFPGSAEVKAIRELRARLEESLKEKDRREVEAQIRSAESLLEVARRVTLSARFREYFDDPARPELEALVASAWRAYRAASLPAAYLKSREGNGAASRLSPQGTSRA